MKEASGDVWQTYPFPPRRKGAIYDAHRMILFPANGYLSRSGNSRRLIMGAGAAKQVKERFQFIDRELAQAIRQVGEQVSEKQPIWRYGVASFTSGIGCFQSKLHWKQPSSLELIQYSTEKLQRRLEADRELLIELIFPGIGLGGLREEDVLPILQELPDSVTVWKL